jgi:hypothetical protein
MVLRFTVMEKKLTNSGPLMESTSKHSIYPQEDNPLIILDNAWQAKIRPNGGL